jgi:hypothetical protein
MGDGGWQIADGRSQMQFAIRYLPSTLRDARIAAVNWAVQHAERFDAAGKLDADDWLVLPRAQLRADFELDAGLADEMARRYFEMLAGARPLPLRVAHEAQGVTLRAPLGKTALVFAEPERTMNAQRVETSWRIAGGFLLAHHVNYGGRLYVGAEWQAENVLKLYTTIRRYPPRLVNYFGVTRGVAVYRRTQGATYQTIQEKFLRTLAARVAQSS